MRLALLNAAGAILEPGTRIPWAISCTRTLAECASWDGADAWLAAAAASGARRVVLAPGTPEASPLARSRPLTSEFSPDGAERSFELWSPRAHQCLDRALGAIERSALKHAVSLVLRPARSTLVSDIPGILALSRRPAWSVLLEPAAVIDPRDPSRVPDHFARLAELVETDTVCAVLVTNSDAGPVHEGTLPAEWFRPIVDAARRAAKPLILLDQPDDPGALRQQSSLRLNRS